MTVKNKQKKKGMYRLKVILPLVKNHERETELKNSHFLKSFLIYLNLTLIQPFKSN